MRFFANANYDFLGKRRLALFVIGLLILPGLLVMLIRGVNYSIEFTGGTLIRIRTQNAVDVGALRSALTREGILDAEIQEFGSNREFAIRAMTARAGEADADNTEVTTAAVTEALDQAVGKGTYTVLRSGAVGPKVGGELRSQAFILVVLSLVAVLSGDGAGGFTSSLRADVPAAELLAAGDLDGDDRPDLSGTGQALWTALSGRVPRRSGPPLPSGMRSRIPGLVLNELMARNTSIPVGPLGEPWDWVELYNGAEAPVALAGYRPICAIYSTFLQRAYDQVFQEVALQKARVLFCLDRGGVVGADGATHNGVFDIAYLRCLPNFTIMSPRDTMPGR